MAFEPGRYAVLEVRDTGSGFEDAVGAQIFEPFFTTKDERGTGLGLAVVLGIVEESGGRVVAESVPGEGTTFRVLLPEAVLQAAGARKPTRQSGTRARARILLVEDNDQVRFSLRRLLEKHGHRVVATHHPDEAIKLIGEGSFNVLVSDMVMQGMNGLDLAQRLRSVHPELAVVLLSGYTDHDALPAVLQAKDIVFLSKPTDGGQLSDAVQRALEQRPASANESSGTQQ